jgi:hypothetical protein
MPNGTYGGVRGEAGDDLTYVRLQAYSNSEVRFLSRHTLSGL